MTALSLDGEKIWQRKLGPYTGLHGSSNSPILAEGMVVLANDQMDPKRFAWYLPKGTNMDPGKSFLIALERKTGKTRWKVDRRSELAGYATPCIRRSGGRTEVVFSSTAHGITAVDLKSGHISWEIDKIWDNRTVSSPQLFGDLVFGSFGKGLSGQRLVAVRPGKGGNKGELVYDITRAYPWFRVSWSRMAFSTFGPTAASSPASTQQQERSIGENALVVNFTARPFGSKAACIASVNTVRSWSSPRARTLKCWPAWNWMKRRLPPRPSPTASCICVRKRVCTRLEKHGRLANGWADGNRGSIMSRAS